MYSVWPYKHCPNTASRSMAITFFVNFLLLDGSVSVKTSLINTKLGDFVYLGVLFNWLCGSIVAYPIIYRLVPSPSRYEISQCDPVTRHNQAIPSFPLDAVFDSSGSKISLFKMAKTRWRKIARGKMFSFFTSEPDEESNKKIRKILSSEQAMIDCNGLLQCCAMVWCNS